MQHWYEESFGEDYLLVYRHRTQQDASFEVSQIVNWLHLNKRDHILDLCCGTGRHTISLARLGLHVMGLDLSKTLLKHAIQDSEGLYIPFIHGDMRYLPFVDETFDVVLNLFTSFGYFIEDEDNAKVLQEIARVTKPGGRFLIDYINRKAVEAKLVPTSEREENGVYIREQRHLKEDFVYKEIWVKDEQGQRYYQERVKMYTLSQMEEMMKKAGFQIEQIYGNFRGEPYQLQSDRMIFLGWIKK